MTSKIITSALTVIGAYAVIRFAYEKGEDKGREALWDYFENASPEDYEKVMTALQRIRSRKQDKGH